MRDIRVRLSNNQQRRLRRGLRRLRLIRTNHITVHRYRRLSIHHSIHSSSNNSKDRRILRCLVLGC